MVLVSQPTHPMFHGDELRHQKCGVCKTEFTCRPPTRHELMTSFTGPEIAALIDVGCVIGSGDEFSVELDAQLATMPESVRASSGYEHWLKSAYLITDVAKDDSKYSYNTTTDEELERLRSAIDPDTLILSVRNIFLKLAPKESLAGQEDDLADAFFNRVTAPANFVFEIVDRNGVRIDNENECGEDTVSAVNLCRPLPLNRQKSARTARALRSAVRIVEKTKGKGWAQRSEQVEVVHHLGGPCDDSTIVTCIVLGATKHGYKVFKDLSEALLVAARLVKNSEDRSTDEGQSNVGPGQRVQLHNLQKNPELNGKSAIIIRRQGPSRWLVRIAEESARLVAAKFENIRADAPPSSRYPNCEEEGQDDGGGEQEAVFSGRVYAFWGDARWSRAQLLGEIARGHWGMCKHSLSEIIAPPHLRRPALDGRLVFAPVTAMTEESIARARTQMAPLREQARLAAAQASEEVERDDDVNDDDQVIEEEGVRRASSESHLVASEVNA